eukprot:TRINITY_DN3245_c0_g1_i2.p1 TRINITY_DN3245_c0_g1~~TRINITY_DN3245_c0_g1_i2.p1  ORF type:complete len:670 (+),score=189.59 TRINITY_DN3245_c0_g1_i2:53-2062(+)
MAVLSHGGHEQASGAAERIWLCSHQVNQTRGFTGTSAASASGPPRPPKPKPYRSTAATPRQEPQENRAVVGDAQRPNAGVTKRWKSALADIWPDRLPGGQGDDIGCNSEVFFNQKQPPQAADLASIATPVSSPGSRSPAARAASPCGTPRRGSRKPLSLVGSQISATTEATELQPSVLTAERAPAAALTLPAALADVAQQASALLSCDVRSSAATALATFAPPAVAVAALPPALPAVAQAAAPVQATVAAIADEAPLGQKKQLSGDACATEDTDLNHQAAAKQRSCSELPSSERARLLEESARRLRSNAERVRGDAVRSRLFGLPQASEAVIAEAVFTSPEEGACLQEAATTAATTATAAAAAATATPAATKHLEDLRKRIAQLDEVNRLEKQRLEQEQRDADLRRQAQETFEKTILEKTERELRLQRERDEQAEAEYLQRSRRAQQELEERQQWRQEQQQLQQQKSRRLHEKRNEGRSEASQMAWWKQFEDELERQWADQEQEERRRLEEYASQRSRQLDEWERRLLAERAKMGHSAEFAEAMRHRKMKSAAFADVTYYNAQRSRSQGPQPAAQPACAGASKAREASQPKAPPSAASAPPLDVKTLSPEERAVVRELQSVQAAPRDCQKAKVKELLLRWHPDKNPDCEALATRVFQFVQKQRQAILGL